MLDEWNNNLPEQEGEWKPGDADAWKGTDGEPDIDKVLGDTKREAAKQLGGSVEHNDDFYITLCEKLYAGSWERFLGDLEDKKAGRPYVFTVDASDTTDIDTHIANVKRLMESEKSDT